MSAEDAREIAALDERHLIVDVTRYFKIRLFPEDQARMLADGVDLGNGEDIVEWLGNDVHDWFDDEDIDLTWAAPQ